MNGTLGTTTPHPVLPEDWQWFYVVIVLMVVGVFVAAAVLTRWARPSSEDG